MTEEASQSCPKCNGEMEQGFVVDMAPGSRVSQWAPGAPFGMFALRIPKSRHPIGTFRCSSCGYLESYAREEFAPGNVLANQFSLRTLLIVVTIFAVALGVV